MSKKQRVNKEDGNFLTQTQSATLHHIPTCQLTSRKPKGFSTLIGYMFDTSRNPAGTVTQKFVTKNPIETSTCHSV